MHLISSAARGEDASQEAKTRHQVQAEAGGYPDIFLCPNILYLFSVSRSVCGASQRPAVISFNLVRGTSRI